MNKLKAVNKRVKGKMPTAKLLSSSYEAANATLQNRQNELGKMLGMYCPHLLYTAEDDMGSTTDMERNGQYSINKNENFTSQAAKMCKVAANTFYQDKLASKGDSFDLQLDSSIDIDDEKRSDVSEQIIKLNKKFASKLDHSNYQETRQLYIMQLVACGCTASIIKYIDDDLQFFVIPVIDLRINNPSDVGEREIHYPMTKTQTEWEDYFLAKNGKVPKELAKMNRQKDGESVNKDKVTLIFTQWPIYVKTDKMEKGQILYHHVLWCNNPNEIIEINKKPTPSKYITFAAMNATPTNPYGCGLGFETMNELMVFDELERLYLEAAEFAADPSYAVQDSVFAQNTTRRVLPGHTYLTKSDPREAISRIDTNTNPQNLAGELARREDKLNNLFIAEKEIFARAGVTATSIQEMLAEAAKQRRMDSKMVGKALEKEADAILSILYDEMVIEDIHIDDRHLLPQLRTHTLKMVFRGLMTELEYVEIARKHRAVLEQIPPSVSQLVTDYAGVIDDYIDSGGESKYFVENYRKVLEDLNESFKNEAVEPQQFSDLNIQSPNIQGIQ